MSRDPPVFSAGVPGPWAVGFFGYGPAKVWNYKLGGYQVLKKWLSYRENKVLGRPLAPEEVQRFTDTARRIAAVLMLTGK